MQPDQVRHQSIFCSQEPDNDIALQETETLLLEAVDIERDGLSSDALSQDSKSAPKETATYADQATLPSFDRDRTTRLACIAGLALSYILGTVLLSASIYITVTANRDDSSRGWLLDDRYVASSAREDQDQKHHISARAHAVIELAMSAGVTLCTEAMGFIHAVSLRWALQRGGSLTWNSNLRLWTQAPGSVVNSWYCNLTNALTLVMSYAAASQILVRSRDGPAVYYNGFALLVLGTGLLVQAAVASACIRRHVQNIKTWSSCPLTVSLACLHQRTGMCHRPGRSMKSFRSNIHSSSTDEGTDSTTVTPRSMQPSLWRTDLWARKVVILTWSLPTAVIIWAIVCKMFKTQDTGISLGHNDWTAAIYGLLLVSFFQSFATMALHSVELLANRSRDEVAWRVLEARRRNRRSGKKAPNAIVSALTSWQSVSLLILKPVIHWLFGNSLSVVQIGTGSMAGVMTPNWIFRLAIGVIFLALLATGLAIHHPRGRMPSTFGHLQTLVDLIDNWGDGDVRKLFWGDKGEHEDGTRYAGTSMHIEDVSDVRKDCLYR